VIKKHYKYKTIFVRKNQQAHQDVFTLLLKSPVTNAKINNAEGTWAIGLVENPPNSINLLKNEFRMWIRRVSQVYCNELDQYMTTDILFPSHKQNASWLEIKSEQIPIRIL
jgi:hypothetical protein